MNRDIDYVLNYMTKYVKDKYMHDSEPMLNHKDIEIVLKYIYEKQQKLERYKNIIDELEKWLEKQYQDTENCFMFDKDLKSKYKRDLLLFSMCLDKLKELKGE